MRYEYKTLVLPMKLGFIKQGLPDLATALNAEARNGWRLCQVITPTNASGQTTDVVAVLERSAS
jgi:hypothetical protein